MITYFIFDVLPRFFEWLSDFIEGSAIYRLVRRIYRWIYSLVHSSFIGSMFCRHKNEGGFYERSSVCRTIDKIIAGFVGFAAKPVRALTPAVTNSGLYSLISSAREKYRFLDFEFICGAVIFVMFMCPGRYWHNVYALIFSAALLIMLTVLCALQKREILKTKTLGLPFIVFAFSTLVGIGIARDIGEALRVFVFFLSAFLFCIVIAGSVTDMKKLRKILAFIYVALVATAVLGFAQRFIGVAIDSELTDITQNHGMPGRVYSTFENPNNYAELIVLMFPLALAYCTMIEDRVKKVLAFGFLCLPVGVLLMTYSRSGWVSFALAALVFVFFYNKKLLPFVMLAGVMCIPILPASIYNRILTIGSTKDSSNMYRIYIWDGVLKMLENNGIIGLGLGPGNFRPDYLTYAVTKASPAPHSHMLYLEVWIEMGLIGIISFLTTYFSTIRRAVVNLKTASKSIRMVLICGVSALAGISFVCAAEYIWFYPRVLFAFFILIGVICAALNINQKEHENVSK